MSALLWLVACGAPTTSDSADSADLVDTGPAPSAWVSCDGTPVLTTCPADALLAEDADAQNVLHVPLTWSWSPECFQSVAAPVYVQVPDDAASITVTVDAGAEASEMDLVRDGVPMPAYNADLFLSGINFGTTRTWPERPEDPEVAGCWAIYPRTSSVDPAATPGQLDVYVRRGDPSTGRLRVVGVIVDDSPITEDDIADVLAVSAGLYEDGGLTLDIAATERMTWSPGDALGDADERAFRQSWTDPEQTGAIPIFFLSSFAMSGVIGKAGGIPGAPRAGTASSGVLLSVGGMWDTAADAPDLDQMGAVVAHELGHQLGLAHLSESNGTLHDNLGDTPECTADRDADGDNKVELTECEGAGADHVMFWQSSADGQTVLSDDERWLVSVGGAVLP